jgi:hypothetical protein
MVESPVAQRFRVMKTARFEHGGNKIDCTLYDLSTTGAARRRLRVSEAALPFPFSPCGRRWLASLRAG